jgi:phospho-N-acetylmuramoyl-pentapeptide-transferase
MLYHLLPELTPYWSVMNVTQYITVRTSAASISAFLLGLVLGPWFIRKLREFQVGQIIRHEGPQSHRAKAGTPTMGGLLILTAALVPTLLWADLTNPYVWVAVVATAACGAVGLLDDYLKITRRSHHGLIPRYKMGGLILVGIGVGLAVLMLSWETPPLYSTRLIFPFFKSLIPDLGYWYVAFAVMVIIGSTNAVNFTDGLDGLAISTFAVAAAAFTALAYVTGPLVQDYIRDGEVHKLKEVMKESTNLGMRTFDQSLFELYQAGEISYEDALRHADSSNEVRLRIKLAQGGDAHTLSQGLDGVELLESR